MLRLLLDLDSLFYVFPSLTCSPMRLGRLGLSTLACGYPHLDRVGDSEIEDDLALDLILWFSSELSFSCL